MTDYILHSAVVDYSTFEILSADTAFYGHLGQERAYSRFDKLICADDVERFKAIVQSKDTDPLVIGMLLENGEIVSVFMKINYSENTMTIEIEPLTELRDGQEIYRKSTELLSELVGLHNDLIYTFDAATETVKIYTPDFKRCTRTCALTEFTEEIRGNIGAEDLEKLDSLIVSLKTEAGSFVYTFEGAILSEMSTCKKSIVKGFGVTKFETITSIGYIHISSNKSEASFTVEKDTLTGTYSKSEIANMARKTIEVECQSDVAICIIDIDYFKNVNDNFGHMMGDVILKDVASIIMNEVGNSGVVGRFGGDEFFVMFYDVDDMENYREKLRSIKNQVCTKYPGSEDGSAVSITLSIGCASYPKDANNYEDLFALADFCLYLAKDKGRNRYIIYNKEYHGTVDEVKNYFKNNRRIDTRKDMSLGDVICMITDMHIDDLDYTPEMLVDDLVENLPIERIVCLAGEPLAFRCMSGINLPSSEAINRASEIVLDAGIETCYKDDVLIVDDISWLKNCSEELYEAYHDLGILSLIFIKFKDAAGKNALVSLEMTTKKVAWNQSQLYSYRMIARMFAKFEL